ncbi:MAG: NCS2 family permease [Synoicihabitans sp.]
MAMRAFTKGDVDGFFALALDNLINLLLISSFCLGMLGFEPTLFFQRMLPGAAIALIVGNVFYARQALALARRENRTDVCALPYGLNIFTTLAFSVLVMLPAQQGALASGLTKPEADLVAWRAGLVACLGSGLIELFGGLVADRLRKILPRAALLATPAMVGLLMISGDFFFKCVGHPYIGLPTLALILAVYYGGMRLRGGIPASAAVLLIGTILAWLLHRSGPSALVPVGSLADSNFGLHLPIPVVGDLIAGLPYFSSYIGVILPMGLLNLIGSLQCLESADAAGDHYAGRPALAMNGLGTLAAACFGSPYPTTLYYGHPGWKAIGSRAGYSTLNAVFFTLILVTGSFSYVAYFVPVEAGMAILVWIGSTIFIQAFSTVPQKHFPAVAIGMLPVVGGFAALVTRHVVAGSGGAFSPDMFAQVAEQRNFAIEGLFATDLGYIFMSVIWAACTAAIIERKFRTAAAWMLVAAVMSAAGLMHAIRIESFDVIGAVAPAWPWVWSYVATAGMLFGFPLIAKPAEPRG